MDSSFLDNYELGSLIDQTPLGRVFRGTHRSMGRAVKITLIDITESTPRDRLLAYEERTRAAAQIRHPAVPAILDFGRQTSRVYRVDEFVESQSLFALFADRGIADPGFLRELFLSITTVLSDVLAMGYLHLQCSPSCIRLRDPADPTSVVIEGFAGKPWGTDPENPQYAAPEQFTEQPQSSAADVYALGLVMWFCLTGSGPTLGSAHLARQAHLSGTPWSLPPLSIPDDLRAVLERCLEKSPRRRFPTVRELAASLRGPIEEHSLVPRPGAIFAGDYEVLYLLGEGGFGQVYAARDVHSGQPVALKLQHPPSPHEGASGHREAARNLHRFQREAQIVAGLRCPFTVRLHAYGRTPEGLQFQVIDWVTGQPLSEVLEEQGALDPWLVERIAHQLLLSLQEAHDAGILHRDIKPANIMLVTPTLDSGESAEELSEVRLLDFGIARFYGERNAENRPQLTQTGTALGTPRYMAPEQLFGQALSPASDLFSLGLVLHELLTGTQAIQGHNTYEIIAQHLRDDPLPPVPDTCSSPLFELVRGLTRRDPWQRIGTAAEAIEVLRRSGAQ